jgi:hypothetical protein
MRRVKQPAEPVNIALRKRHRHISPAPWSAVAAFVSRERSLLVEAGPGSPRICPMLAPLVWLDLEVPA